ncbi:murein hydrolase activator EnvC family protein [Sphingobium sp. B12D2B]|uniref:murein hydrolase activator EnvC family protein n=1 Tax=Sphingobium sp. B12D2B TaxID=2940577 RepID=UPI0022250DF8|nr:peptidoglycan DD-metalloendopeptidase family protein [Sphingobium sp. B12D2B]MCW2351174.1 septal ring factor EnvC (AmiA/AmiB activator) [Sphingobium sp. B12D2B]
MAASWTRLRRPLALRPSLPVMLATAALLITAIAAPLALSAQRNPAPQAAQAEIARQQAALARARAQGEEARKRGEALEARARASSAAADKTRNEIAALAARIQQSEADLRAGEARMAIIITRQREQRRQLATRQQPIVRLTAALQQLARRSPVLALVAPGTISEAVHRRIALAQILPTITASTQDLRGAIARSADLQRSAEAAAQSLVRTRAGLKTQQAALSTLEQRQRGASRQLRAEASLQTERALAMGEQARDISDLMDRIGDAAQVQEALLRLPGPMPRPARPQNSAAPAPERPSVAAGQTPAPPYRLPAIGEIVTGFGELSAGGVRARGITMATAASAAVIAPAAGRVAFAGPFRGYGKIVILEHRGGWTSLLAGLDRLSVAPGDLLRQGDPVGATGSDPARLIIELRQQDRAVDIAALVR